MSLTLPLLAQILAAGLPRPVEEVRFAPPRRWRFDYFFPNAKPPLGIEVDGGTWLAGGGRHNRGKGYAKDCIKLNTAAIMGIRVLRFTTEQVANGVALAMIQKALKLPT